MRNVFLITITMLSLLIVSCRDDGWGEESSLNGTWHGTMNAGGGISASMEVTLKDGNVSNGKLDYGTLKVSSIVGNYQYDGENFEMDFDNEASDFEGAGSSSSLSGDRVVGGKVDGSFSIEKY